jgi:DNA-binding CsgD family transcriptional regulator
LLPINFRVSTGTFVRRYHCVKGDAAVSQLADAHNRLVLAAAEGGTPSEQSGALELAEPQSAPKPVELHHNILTVLRAVVRADVAYCYTGNFAGSAEIPGSVLSAQTTLSAPKRTYSQLIASVQARGNRISACHIFTALTKSSVFVAPSLVCTSSNGLLLSLQTERQWLGVAGVARCCDSDVWEQEDVANLGQVVSAICSLVELHQRCAELSRYALARRQTGKACNVLCVINLSSPRIAWLNTEQLSEDERRRLLESEAELQATASALAHGSKNRSIYWSCGRIKELTDLGESALFGVGRSVLLDLDFLDSQNGAPRLGLSTREREIADLLVAGYAAINAAAVLHLSEHTVRTYIRRLYRKLNVSNRADLVRELIGSAAYDPGVVGDLL